MQVLYDYQQAARTASKTARQRVPLPALQTYSDLPREWPMARLAISNKQINRLVRTFLWRRVTEQALHGSSFVNIPDEINQAHIGDLIRTSEAFAAPPSNLFAFVKSGHPACPFITHKQLALCANPRFWQYGLLACVKVTWQTELFNTCWQSCQQLQNVRLPPSVMSLAEGNFQRCLCAERGGRPGVSSAAKECLRSAAPRSSWCQSRNGGQKRPCTRGTARETCV